MCHIQWLEAARSCIDTTWYFRLIYLNSVLTCTLIKAYLPTSSSLCYNRRAPSHQRPRPSLWPRGPPEAIPSTASSKRSFQPQGSTRRIGWSCGSRLPWDSRSDWWRLGSNWGPLWRPRALPGCGPGVEELGFRKVRYEYYAGIKRGWNCWSAVELILYFLTQFKRSTY